ncbi:MFS transporter [Caulobacter sp. KR2-114]|uniref:MFS transporter n=1 Tax=Caulobacter sp. KR2-114 TaxID=3400912 RepID=UPI003C0D2634
MTTTSPDSAKSVPLPNILAFGTLGMPLAALLLVYGLYLPRFYAGLGLSFIAVSGAVASVRFVDMAFDPIIALVMDRTRTPLGRYRPWLILGAPIAMLGAWKLLIPAEHPTVGYLITWLIVTYAGTSMLTLGVAAWSAILARGYHDRSRVYGWTQGMGVVGSVAFLLLPVFTHGKVVAGKAASMPAICMILLVALPIGALITALFTPEKILQPADRPRFKLSDYWGAISRPTLLRVILADLVLTLGPGTTAPLYVYFFHDAKGFSIADVGFLLIFYIGAGIIGAPVWARVARRFGKHRTIQIACVFYAIFQTILMALPRVHEPYARPDTLPTAAGMFCVGFCASAFLLLIRAMVADIVDEVKLEQKQDLTSLLFSMVTTTTKIGSTITVLIVFPILQFVGYNGKEGAVNTPHAIFGLEMCYLFAPIILVFFGGAMLFGYKLDAKRHAEIQAALEQEAASAHLAASEESLIGPTAGAPAE